MKVGEVVVDGLAHGVGGGVGRVGGQDAKVVDETVLGDVDPLEPLGQGGGLCAVLGLLGGGSGGKQFGEPLLAAGVRV